VAVKVIEVQNMARHVLRIALVLWLSGQHSSPPYRHPNWEVQSGVLDEHNIPSEASLVE
jgi:hypothetical protein